MPAIVLVGAQWGDEGKGKATDLLGGRVRRWCGIRAATTPATPSSCRGREVRAAPDPVGHPHARRARNVIGNGVVVDPGVLLDEIAGLDERGVDTRGC